MKTKILIGFYPKFYNVILKIKKKLKKKPKTNKQKVLVKTIAVRGIQP